MDDQTPSKQQTNRDTVDKNTLLKYGIFKDPAAFSIEDEGETERTIKYPIGIYFFLIYHVLCSTAKFGYQAIWVLQLHTYFKFSYYKSIVVYHIFYGLKHFFSFVGCIVAESYLGQFETISKFALVSATGLYCLTFGSLPHARTAIIIINVVGALIFAIGHGFIDSCLIAFGASQFNFRLQTYETLKFFEVFGFLTNLSGLATYILVPYLRDGVQCFREMDCYFLAYGLPTILFSIGIVFLFVGKSFYIITKPSINMVNIVTNIFCDAIKERATKGKNREYVHWLDYAEDKHSVNLIDDLKLILPTMKLLLPLIMFFALIEQQRSRWVLQASEMDGNFALVDILPDQMQLFNPIFLIILTPTYKFIIYPKLGGLGIHGSLNKMVFGAVLASISFFCAAIVQYNIELHQVRLPSTGKSQLRVVNGIQKCDYEITHNIPEVDTFRIKSFGYYVKDDINTEGYNNFTVEYKAILDECPKGNKTYWKIKEDGLLNVYLYEVDKNVVNMTFKMNLKIRNNKFPVLHLFSKRSWYAVTITFKSEVKMKKIRMRHPHDKILNLRPDSYDISIDNIFISKENLKMGGIYLYIFDQSTQQSKLHTVAQSNFVSILWQLPQIAIMELSEIIILYTGVEYSYSKAPFSLKSVMHAYWFLIISAGSFLIILIDILPIKSELARIILYATLMLVASFIMYCLSNQYKKKLRLTLSSGA